MPRAALLRFVAALLLAASASAENLEIFKASRAGEAAWVWGEARLREKLGKLVISENSKSDKVGDVFTAEKFPYFENGVVELLVDQVAAGSYSLQVLGFKGETHLGTLQVVSAETTAGRKAIPLRGRNMPEGVDRVVFKIWVGDAEGASIKISDLVYWVTLPEDGVLLDERGADPSVWEAHDLLLETGPQGAVLHMKPGYTFGDVLHSRRFDRAAADTIYLEAADVLEGDLTVQLVPFDPDGNYLDSVDVIRKVAAGPHAVRLAGVQWPDGADTFGIKVWLGGQANAKATLKRLLVLGKPAL